MLCARPPAAFLHSRVCILLPWVLRLHLRVCLDCCAQVSIMRLLKCFKMDITPCSALIRVCVTLATSASRANATNARSVRLPPYFVCTCVALSHRFLMRLLLRTYHRLSMSNTRTVSSPTVFGECSKLTAGCWVHAQQWWSSRLVLTHRFLYPMLHCLFCLCIHSYD
jgi:hypothetical protein